MRNLLEIINKKIEEIRESGQLVVLKGFSNFEEISGRKNVDLNEIINDKMGYYLKNFYNKDYVISYEEYLSLYSFFSMQNKKITILENNIYINLYPLIVPMLEETKDKLINHFDDDKEGEKYEIGDISGYTEIFSNFIKIDEEYYVAYNENLNPEKEHIVKIFDRKQTYEINSEYVVSDVDSYDLNDEEDYLRVLKKIDMSSSRTVNIVIKKIIFNKFFVNVI